MQYKNVKSFSEIETLAGGPTALALICKVHQTTIDAWRRRGIPTKYWGILSTKLNVSPSDLYFISQKAQKSVA